MLEPSDPVPVEDAVATVGAVCALPHVGGAAAAKPAPEIDNRFEEAGGQSQSRPSHKTRIHTACIT